MMTDEEVLQYGMECAGCKTKEEFYTFILVEYGDESEQAKFYKIGMYDPKYVEFKNKLASEMTSD